MVIDTAVVVSALVFDHGRVSFVREAWSRGRLRPVVSRATVTELLRVLAYPKFQLSSEEVETLLAAYLPFVETIAVEGDLEALPRCSDRHDQKFLELAQVAGADAVVTGDRALLALDEEVAFDIVRPSELKDRLAGA